MRFALFLSLAVVVASVGTPPATALELGQSVGPVGLTTLLGDRLVMNNYGERPGTAVLFLSGRCEVTERMIEALDRFYEKHRRRNVLFVGVCSNPAESPEELRTFAQRRGIIFPVYRDPDGELAGRFGARAAPAVFLLDHRGSLVFHGGLQDRDARQAFETAVGSLIAKQPIAVATYRVEGTPIDRPGPLRQVDDPYRPLSFSSELVFEKIPEAAAHHCSTICEAANRDFLCLWYGGSYESADDQALYLSRKKLGEKDWTTPQRLLQNSLQPPGNGVIFRHTGDRLWIVWTRMEGTRPMRRGSGWDRCRLMVRTSDDHGVTWSEDHPLLEETVWCVPRNPPIALADQTLLLPVEGLLNEVEGSHFLVLAPGAAAWQRAGFTDGGSQPAVVQRRDGSLLALLRHAGHITQIESRDKGHAWTKALATPLKNPDAGITMTKLANDHLVLVFNDSSIARTPLCIARSLDEGKTWERPLHLESNPGEYSYPCIIQSSDGTIHVTYTFRRYAIKHVALNEDWMVHFERPD